MPKTVDCCTFGGIRVERARRAIKLILQATEMVSKSDNTEAPYYAVQQCSTYLCRPANESSCSRCFEAGGWRPEGWSCTSGRAKSHRPLDEAYLPKVPCPPRTRHHTMHSAIRSTVLRGVRQGRGLGQHTPQRTLTTTRLRRAEADPTVNEPPKASPGDAPGAKAGDSALIRQENAGEGAPRSPDYNVAVDYRTSYA